MSSRKFGITTNLSGLDQGLLVNSISFNENPQVAQARDEKGKLIDLATYSTEKNVTIDGLYLDDMLSCGSYINIGFDQYLITSKAKRETNTSFQTGTINAQRVSANISPTVIFDIPGFTVWDFSNSSTSSMNFANYVSAIPDCTEINYDLKDILYDNLPNGITFNNGILSANKDLMSGDYNSVLSLNVSAYFQSGVIIQESSPYFTFMIQNVTDPAHTPLTFKGLSNSNIICLSAIGTPSNIVLKTKINDGEWTSIQVDHNTYFTARLNQGDTIAFSGANDHFSDNFLGYYQFNMSGIIEASGNIQSLMNFSDNCTEFSYIRLFRSCTSLVTPPQLPATTLAQQCYEEMFYDCSSLITTPDLPATTLANSCYQSMFKGCSSLSTALTLPATELAPSCYKNMFSGCRNLTSAPQLPATVLCGACYSQMFVGCTSLTASPDLPATTLAEGCYLGMFTNCSNLRSITVNFTTWNYSTYKWVEGVGVLGWFTKPTDLPELYNENRIPNGWTVINKD